MSKQEKNEAIKNLIQSKINPKSITISVEGSGIYKKIPSEVASIDVECPDMKTAELLSNFLNDDNI